jgi:hypothetical protein
MTFEFGDRHPDYPVRVLNEREVRAGAGILLVIALVAFQNAFQTGDFALTRLVILGFGAEFFIRVFIGPRYAPSLILGRFMVARQVPEFSGAPQKRFAWALGLALAVVMGIWVIGFNMAGPVALIGCLTCVVLLFCESAFGICVGCKLYNLVWPGQARLCPGGVCELPAGPRAPRIGAVQVAILAGFVAALGLAAPRIAALEPPRMPARALLADGTPDCTPPAIARLIGHEARWRERNGCN